MTSLQPILKKVTNPCISIQDPYLISPKTVIVTGCGRGGTSAITGVIHALGIAMVDDAETSVILKILISVRQASILSLKVNMHQPMLKHVNKFDR